MRRLLPIIALTLFISFPVLLPYHPSRLAHWLRRLYRFSSPYMAAQAAANPLENYRFEFDDKWDEKLIDLMENNQDLFILIINDPEFGAYLKGLIMEKVCLQQLTRAGASGPLSGSGPHERELRA